MKKVLTVVLMGLACVAAYAETDYTVERKVDYLWRHIMGGGGGGGDYPTKEWVTDQIGEEAQARADGDSALSDRVTEVEGAVPTKVSDLDNDAGYVTSVDVPTDVSELNNDVGYITSGDVPTAVSAFSNDAGYITAGDVPTAVSAFSNDVGYITASDIPAQVQSDWSETNSASPAYIDNKPTIPTVPTAVSAFSNDVGYITSGDIPTAVSAFSNDAGYITASDIPAQVQSDWSETNSASPAYIDHKPALITSNEVSEIARNIAKEVVDEMTTVGWGADGVWYRLVVQAVPYPLTVFTLDGGTEEVFDISGTLDQQWMIDNGYYGPGGGPWLRTITQASVGANVTNVGGGAFVNCDSLTNVVVGVGVTSIEDDAFFGCTGLTDVVLSDSVVSLGGFVFYRCSGLTSVAIPDSVTRIGQSAFSLCTGLTGVTIPNSVTNIGSGAFSDCSGMTSVTIGNGVTSLGGWAFSSCSGLTSVTIPDSVTNIGDGAFSGCSGLTNVTMSGKTVAQVSTMGYSSWNLPSGCVIVCTDGTLPFPAETTFTLAGGTEEVVDISGTLDYQWMGDNGYYDDDSDEWLKIIAQAEFGTNVTRIGDAAFLGCTSLTNVTIPDSVTAISDDSFSGCSNLMSVGMSGRTAAIVYGMYDYSWGLPSGCVITCSDDTITIP